MGIFAGVCPRKLNKRGSPLKHYCNNVLQSQIPANSVLFKVRLYSEKSKLRWDPASSWGDMQVGNYYD